MPNMKTSHCLLFCLSLILVASLKAELPPHASLLPENPLLLISLHPGQLMQKANHQSLINKPTVASLYSASSSTGIFDNFDVEEDEFEEHHALITQLIEKPAETTGIDLSQPVFLALPGVANLELQFIAKLKDPKNFESFLPKLVRSDIQWRDTEGGNRAFVFIEDQRSIIVHNHNTVIIKGTMNNQKPTWVKEADQWLSKKEVKIPQFLSSQLSQSPDAGVYLSLAPVMPFFSKRLGEGQSPPKHLKDTHLFLALNSKEGSIVADLNTFIGEKNSIQLGSKPLGNEFFDFMDQDSLLKATISLNLDTAFDHLMHALPFTGIDTEEFAEEIQEAFNIDYKEIPELFSGQAVFSITGMVFEEEEFEFLAAIGTKIPAAEVYVKIIQKGLLGAFRGEAPRNNNPLSNLSIVAKDNLLLIASKNHANLLESGKVAKPLKKKERSVMKSGLFNLLLDFPKLVKSLEQTSEELAEDEEFQFVTQRVLPIFSSFGAKSVQVSENTYKTSYTLSFKNKDNQGLETLTHHIADLANPYLFHPINRQKILASEAKAAKDPEQYQKDIVGIWSGNFEDEESKNYYKVKVDKNGSMHYEEIYITKEDFERHSSKGKWTLEGTTFKDYNESGGLEFVATVVTLDEDTLEYFDYFEFDFYDEEMEPTQERKVDEDYKLPDPPKGLKEFKEE